MEKLKEEVVQNSGHLQEIIKICEGKYCLCIPPSQIALLVVDVSKLLVDHHQTGLRAIKLCTPACFILVSWIFCSS